MRVQAAAAEVAGSFPPIDAARPSAGKLFTRTARLPRDLETDGQMHDYQLHTLDEVGTDPLTAIASSGP